MVPSVWIGTSGKWRGIIFKLLCKLSILFGWQIQICYLIYVDNRIKVCMDKTVCLLPLWLIGWLEYSVHLGRLRPGDYYSKTCQCPHGSTGEHSDPLVGVLNSYMHISGPTLYTYGVMTGQYKNVIVSDVAVFILFYPKVARRVRVTMSLAAMVTGVTDHWHLTWWITKVVGFQK